MTADEALDALYEAVADLRAGVVRIERDGAAEVFVSQRLVLAVQDACDDLLNAAPRRRGAAFRRGGATTGLPLVRRQTASANSMRHDPFLVLTRAELELLWHELGGILLGYHIEENGIGDPHFPRSIDWVNISCCKKIGAVA